MDRIANSLMPFCRVGLPDLDKVKLMNRIDQKFCLHIKRLPTILNTICPNYSLLEIQNETIFRYNNIYFDTLENEMFLAHQNGKLNRFKIRLRQYAQSQDNFLEIKFKTNKGRTIKKRINKQNFQPVFKDTELDFLQKSSPYLGTDLLPKITNRFNRITLVDNQFTERVTIDMFPRFKNQEKEIILKNLVIIEVKQNRNNKPATITQVLHNNNIRKQGFSKYCIGRSLLEEGIKKNNFKPLLLKIRKDYMN